MRSYRNAYPSGAVSASAAYRYAGDIDEASLFGLSSQGDGGLQRNPLGLWGRDKVYCHDSGLYTRRDPIGGVIHQPFGRSLRAQDADSCGVAVYSETDLHGGMRNPEIFTRSFLTDSYGLERDRRASEGKALYAGGNSFSLLSAETDSGNYGRLSDAYVSSTCKQKVERTPHAPLQAPARKRKTPSLDEIIRETWELHSLFWAGLAASSDVTENSTDNIMRSEQWNKPSQKSIAGDSGWDCADKPLQKGPVFEETWHLVNNGQMDTISSWNELTKETNGATSYKKLKESSPQLDTEQEQHASDLQRSICGRVEEFMGKYSDGDSSDDDSFVDSDEDAPNVTADSSCDVKSREEQAFAFFSQTFLESKELQKLYSEKCHVGKFTCLVCSSIPGKPAKKYKGLISVIMHASKVLKTKKKQEHRGYARALCSAMGWDLCRLPTMPSSSSPHPRCCIPTNEDESTDDKQTEQVVKVASRISV